MQFDCAPSHEENLEDLECNKDEQARLVERIANMKKYPVVHAAQIVECNARLKRLAVKEAALEYRIGQVLRFGGLAQLGLR